MSSKVKVKLNKAEIRKLLRSSEAQEVCMSYAHRIQQIAGPDYEADKRNYPERSGAAVYPANDDGYYDNLQHNTLLKAKGSV